MCRHRPPLRLRCQRRTCHARLGLLIIRPQVRVLSTLRQNICHLLSKSFEFATYRVAKHTIRSQLTNTFPSTPATSFAEAPGEQLSAVPNSLSAPGLREMTNVSPRRYCHSLLLMLMFCQVWSVSSTARPKIRTRRAMTEAEKKEYRRKRIDGACTDCRRRRRKVLSKLVRLILLRIETNM